jgi:hypothetical protein
MQVVVFGAHDAPRERLALSYTSRRDHLGAEKPRKPPFSFLRPLCPMHVGFEDEQADR